MPFSAIKGQEQALRILRENIRQDTRAGAYLFAGPHGVGKFMAAMEFAKALNCAQAGAEACGSCASCVKIDKRQHPDVLVVDNGEDEVKIDDIRAIQRQLSLRPYEGAVKVAVIRHAHAINPSSGNALLKTLEEPPANSVLVLVTEYPGMIFKTILSRCRIVRFRSFARAQLESLLSSEYGYEASAARLLAFVCEGKLGAALGRDAAQFLRERDEAVAAFGIPSRIVPAARGACERAHVRQTLNMLALWFRDVYCVKLGVPSSLIANVDRSADLAACAREVTWERLDAILQNISAALSYNEHNVNARLILAHLAWYLKG